MAIDLKNSDIFFAEVRKTIFGGTMSQAQVDGINWIFAAFEKYEFVEDQEERAYILATAFWESGRTMQPVEEGFYLGSKAENFRRKLRYFPYYGRGYVQLTWDYNYKKLGALLGVDLYHHPELALDPEIAAGVLIVGMMRGLFAPAAGPLSKYLATAEKWIEARHTVNGKDRDTEIAAIAIKFDAAMEKAEGKIHVHVQVDPAVPTQVQPAPTSSTTTHSMPTQPVETTKPASTVLDHPAMAPTAVGGVGAVAAGIAASQSGLSWGWIIGIIIVAGVIGTLVVAYNKSQTKGK